LLLEVFSEENFPCDLYVCGGFKYEKDFEQAYYRKFGKRSLFNTEIVYENSILKTIASMSCAESVVFDTKRYISIQDIISSQTFPCDYNFFNQERKNINQNILN
jgi:hypothetical protein